MKNKLKEFIAHNSIKTALSLSGLCSLTAGLRKIIPDISQQENSTGDTFNAYWELKRRGLQAFQCQLMMEALKMLPQRDLAVVDIGDSAGTHMLYLKSLAKNRNIDSLSINLDKRAIEKIRSRGMKAVLARAEDCNFGIQHIDMAVSFEMIEHLHNPLIFLRRMAKKTDCGLMALTVPYLRQSRIGCYNIRNNNGKQFFAEDEHIFELSPQDWKLLMLFSGWEVVYSKIYYQYPRRIPVLSSCLAWFWKNTDFEGFWGVILKKNTRHSDLYQDWDE